MRGLDATGVIARLRDGLHVPGITLSMQPVQDLSVDSTVSRAQYHFFLENPDAGQFAIWVPRLMAALDENPAFAAVTSDMNTNGHALDITIDRPTAARFGITPATIDNALYDAFGQRIISTLYTQSNQYRVILQADTTDLVSIQQALDAIYLPSATATSGQVPLAAMVRVATRAGPLQVEHLGQFPAVSVSFNLAPGASLDVAVDAIGAAERAIGLPDSFTTAYQGALSAFQASLSNELLLILAALVAVYVVLGVLYESFIHPLTILSTLPSAGVGALIALDISGHDLDVIGIIGIILLIGIVKKNAIMMIDFALAAERTEGKPPREAIFQACLLRFRPILMTTMAALLGRAAADAGQRVGLGAAAAAGHRHRGRPAGQPGADAVHHAGDLPRVRPPRRLTGAAEPDTGERGSGGMSGAAEAPASPAGGERREADVNISAPFITRPIATTLLTLAILLAGALAFFQLPVASLPQVDFPTISVQAQLPGADPETVATSLAGPLERHLGQIADVTEMTSQSQVGQARINMQFGLDRDINGAARDVQAAINAARADLPTNLLQQPDLPQGEPGRRADPDRLAHLRHAHPRADLRRGQHRAVAAAVAARRRRPGHHQRRRAAGGAGGAAAAGAVQVRHRAGGRARHAGRGQRQRAEGRRRARRRAAADLHQRPGQPRRRLPAADRGLPQRRTRCT